MSTAFMEESNIFSIICTQFRAKLPLANNLFYINDLRLRDFRTRRSLPPASPAIIRCRHETIKSCSDCKLLQPA